MSNIEFYFEDIKEIPIKHNHITKSVENLIKSEKFEFESISIIFCSDAYLLDMNKQYLKHDYYTDIITFDYVEDNVISGDLFISLDRLRENAAIHCVELSRELYRVVFHGVLHLVGYKDKTEEEQELMTKKENHYLGEVDFSGIEL